MGKLEKFGGYSKIIGKSNNIFLVTNTKDATINDGLELAAILDSNGKYLTKSLPIYYFMKDSETTWEPINGKFSDFIRIDQKNTTRDGLIGLAIGDALGVPLEFMKREDVKHANIKDMIGKEDDVNIDGMWSNFIPAGAWSDDTSMTIATMDTIIKNDGAINYDNIMQGFISWWKDGKYISSDEPFGLGSTVSHALDCYVGGIPSLECGGKNFRDNGNGAIMRIFPFSLYTIALDMDEEETVDFINKASGITHGHDISKMSCFIYTEFLKCLIITKNPKIAYQYITSIDYGNYYSKIAIEAHSKLLMPNFLLYTDDDIPENNGYVVVTLESAIHCLISTDNFEDAILKSINLGYDTDTVGAVTGSLAGVLYGYNNIPDRWINKIKKKEELETIAENYENILNSIQKKNMSEVKSH